jgi:hypothetical protein
VLIPHTSRVSPVRGIHRWPLRKASSIGRHNNSSNVKLCKMYKNEYKYIPFDWRRSLHFLQAWRLCHTLCTALWIQREPPAAGGKGPPLWSSGQSFWLQIQRSGFDSQRYQTFWEVWNGVHLASRVQLKSHLEEKVAAPAYITENPVVRTRQADHVTSSIRKSWH